MFDTSQPQCHLPQGALLERPPSATPLPLAVQWPLLQLWSHAHYVPLIGWQTLLGRQQLEEEAALGEFPIFMASGLRTGASLCYVVAETQIESHIGRFDKPEERIWENPSSWKTR